MLIVSYVMQEPLLNPDNIPVKFLKDSANCMTPMVTHIINHSICQDKVPDELKQARVIPLFKKR